MFFKPCTSFRITPFSQWRSSLGYFGRETMWGRVIKLELECRDDLLWCLSFLKYEFIKYGDELYSLIVLILLLLLSVVILTIIILCVHISFPLNPPFWFTADENYCQGGWCVIQYHQSALTISSELLTDDSPQQNLLWLWNEREQQQQHAAETLSWLAPHWVWQGRLWLHELSISRNCFSYIRTWCPLFVPPQLFFGFCAADLHQRHTFCFKLSFFQIHYV